MKHTTIINLYGGPGSGKSTTAAGIFHELKTANLNAELIQEHAKEWAWEGRKIGKFDQVTLLAEQLRREMRLIGKVDYIVTDSPSLLSAFYEQYYHQAQTTLPILAAVAEERRKAAVTEINLYLPNVDRHIQDGRYETKEQAAAIHVSLLEWLKEQNVSVSTIERDPKVIVKSLLQL